MLITGGWGTFGLCLACAAALRDTFLEYTEQRPSPLAGDPQERDGG